MDEKKHMPTIGTQKTVNIDNLIAQIEFRKKENARLIEFAQAQISSSNNALELLNEVRSIHGSEMSEAKFDAAMALARRAKEVRINNIMDGLVEDPH